MQTFTLTAFAMKVARSLMELTTALWHRWLTREQP